MGKEDLSLLFCSSLDLWCYQEQNLVLLGVDIRFIPQFPHPVSFSKERCVNAPASLSWPLGLPVGKWGRFHPCYWDHCHTGPLEVHPCSVWWQWWGKRLRRTGMVEEEEEKKIKPLSKNDVGRVEKNKNIKTILRHREARQSLFLLHFIWNINVNYWWLRSYFSFQESPLRVKNLKMFLNC